MTTVQLIAVCTTCTLNSGCEHILQEISLPTAVRKSAPWTVDEIEFIRETMDEPLGDVALILNRTYYAVSKTRSLLKRGILKA